MLVARNSPLSAVRSSCCCSAPACRPSPQLARCCASTARASGECLVVLAASASPCSSSGSFVAAAAPRAACPGGFRRPDVSLGAKASKGVLGTEGSVKLIIQGRKLEVTEAIREYVEDKVTRALANVAEVVKEVDVALSARGGDTGTPGKKEQKVDVTVYTFRNGVIRVEDVEVTLYAAVDLVCDKLARKMTKTKEIGIAKGKWPGHAADKGTGKRELEQEYQEARAETIYETQVFDREEKIRADLAEYNKAFPAAVRRTKVMELDPISCDEAIEALDAIGHDFYVFREIATDEIQVVYRRAEEGYGILVPKKRD